MTTCYIPCIAENLDAYFKHKKFLDSIPALNRKAYQNAFCQTSVCGCDIDIPNDDCNFDAIAKKYSMNCNKTCPPKLNCCNDPEDFDFASSLYKKLIANVLSGKFDNDNKEYIDLSTYLHPSGGCCV